MESRRHRKVTEQQGEYNYEENRKLRKRMRLLKKGVQGNSEEQRPAVQ